MDYGSRQAGTDTERRVLAALRGEQPDRVPVLSYFNPYVENWYTHVPSYAGVLSASERYADVVCNWNAPAPLMFTGGHRWIEQRDLGRGQTEQIIHTPDGPITEVVRTGLRAREVVKRWIETVQDAERAMSIPYVPIKPDLETFFAVRNRLAGRAVAQAAFRGPNALVDWIHPQSLAKWCTEDGSLIHQLLDMLFERIGQELQTCLEAGVGPIFALSRSRLTGVEPDVADEFADRFVDYDRHLVERVHQYEGRMVTLRAVGKLAPILDGLATIGMDGLTLTEPPVGGDYNLAHVKERIGDRVCLIAAFSYEELARGSTAHVERLVHNALAAGAEGGGFILSPCPEAVERDLPEQTSSNLVHFLETANQAGRYPIKA